MNPPVSQPTTMDGWCPSSVYAGNHDANNGWCDVSSVSSMRHSAVLSNVVTYSNRAPTQHTHTHTHTHMLGSP
mgnify:CR=1 FL=1